MSLISFSEDSASITSLLWSCDVSRGSDCARGGSVRVSGARAGEVVVVRVDMELHGGGAGGVAGL